MPAVLDETIGRPAIALAASGGKAWHGYGQLLPTDADVDTWRRAAGLDWTVEAAPVHYRLPEGSVTESERLQVYDDRVVLYRSDTFSPLSVVSNRYKIVQPKAVLEFFRDLVEFNQFSIETAGALNGGRRIWALAKVNAEAEIIKGDGVSAYVLLATSFDGGLATVAKFTPIRVVCQNTLTMALGGQGQKVSVGHNTTFDAALVRSQLGLASEQFTEFVELSRRLQKASFKADQVEKMLVSLLKPRSKIEKYQRTDEQVMASKGYQKIMALFEGEAMGSDIPGISGTAWALFNSITQYYDHEVTAASDESRLNSAWFGQGEEQKQLAWNMIHEAI